MPQVAEGCFSVTFAYFYRNKNITHACACNICKCTYELCGHIYYVLLVTRHAGQSLGFFFFFKII